MVAAVHPFSLGRSLHIISHLFPFIRCLAPFGMQTGRPGHWATDLQVSGNFWNITLLTLTYLLFSKRQNHFFWPLCSLSRSFQLFQFLILKSNYLSDLLLPKSFLLNFQIDSFIHRRDLSLLCFEKCAWNSTKHSFIHFNISIFWFWLTATRVYWDSVAA